MKSQLIKQIPNLSRKRLLVFCCELFISFIVQLPKIDCTDIKKKLLWLKNVYAFFYILTF